MPKNQGELQGMGRASIKDLDESITELVKLEDQFKRAKTKYKAQYAIVLMRMIKHQRKKYIFIDGTVERVCELFMSQEKLRTTEHPIRERGEKGKGKTAKPPTQAKPSGWDSKVTNGASKPEPKPA
ncbi:hypothetical protein [Microbacterium sp.]|uniref:hypothetical protein n=1 Tax=Microbacterium sp. TaxID=51671 RepID=UPI002E30CE11|nr:hypothetical protein [Microbacterium sp.]HEX5730941.1 hypothetical protein [Microbacterium sp.]